MAGHSPTHPRLERGNRARLAAWIATGPAGHLWSAVADICVMWVRFAWARARRRTPGRLR